MRRTSCFVRWRGKVSIRGSKRKDAAYTRRGSCARAFACTCAVVRRLHLAMKAAVSASGKKRLISITAAAKTKKNTVDTTGAVDKYTFKYDMFPWSLPFPAACVARGTNRDDPSVSTRPRTPAFVSHVRVRRSRRTMATTFCFLDVARHAWTRAPERRTPYATPHERAWRVAGVRFEADVDVASALVVADA